MRALRGLGVPRLRMHGTAQTQRDTGDGGDWTQFATESVEPE